jgi:hypothetical protein
MIVVSVVSAPVVPVGSKSVHLGRFRIHAVVVWANPTPDQLPKILAATNRAEVFTVSPPYRNLSDA